MYYCSQFAGMLLVLPVSLSHEAGPAGQTPGDVGSGGEDGRSRCLPQPHAWSPSLAATAQTSTHYPRKIKKIQLAERAEIHFPLYFSLLCSGTSPLLLSHTWGSDNVESIVRRKSSVQERLKAHSCLQHSKLARELKK